jgi:FAD/FMN-containing dehydrogenase/Fe-S oxidoreductase
MPHLGPHISIAEDALVPRVFEALSAAEFAAWPADVRELTASLAAELFLVRANPFIDPDLVRQSVSRRLFMARPTLSGEFPRLLKAAVDGFWERFAADRAFCATLRERLAAILPAECISDAPNSLIECATDATDLRFALPMLVLFPEEAAQIEAVAKLANELGFAIVPRGGGTGLTGGAIPLAPRTVILSLSRFKRILDIDPGKKILCAQSGVITQDAITAAAEQNLLFTVDPASKSASTLGGNVSENSGGPCAFEYGTTIDAIESYEMVTPLGERIRVRRVDHPRHKILPTETAVFEVLDAAGRVVETVSLAGDALRGTGLGKDVSNKFLGGLPGVQKEGVDGIVTEACFVLHDRPKHSRTLCLEFFGRSMRPAMLVIRDVVALRDQIRRQGDRVKISALEEFGTKYVKAIEYKKKSVRFEGEPISVLLVQLDSDDEAELAAVADAIADVAAAVAGVDVFQAATEKEAELFWEDRHRLSAISRRTSGFKINEDVVIPLAAIPSFADFIEDLNLKYLARGLRRCLLKVRELPGIPADAPRIEEALAKARAVLRRDITARELSDDEYEVEIGLLFQELRDLYPKRDREIEALHQELSARRIVVANHMHAGDGNCHVNVPVNSNDPEMLALAFEAVDEVFREVIGLGGGVSGEHGIGVTKIAYLSEDKIAAIRDYKAKVDPNGVLNPGKLVKRELPAEPYTFSFNRLIGDLDKTALKDKEDLIALLKSIQTCTRCGKCKQVCPMYYPQRGLLFHPRNKNLSLGALVEAIAYSQVQAGEPDPRLLAKLRRLMEHCTACGKCTAVCPIRIDSAKAALTVRAFLEYKGQGGHPLKTRVLQALARDPAGRLPRAAKVVSAGQTAANRVLPLVPGPWRRRRQSPLLQSPGPHLDFRNLAEDLRLAERSIFRLPGVPADETVLYFPGCGAGLFSRSIGLAALYLLLKSGANAVLPDAHLCCGYPLLAAGCVEAYNTNRLRTLQHILDLLIKTGRAGLKATRLLTSCGTCRESLESFEFAREIHEPLVHEDVLQFLVGRLPPLDGQGGVLYHAACHGEWVGAPKAKAPAIYRQALSGLLGAKVALSPGCCGESGLGALTSPAIYNRLRERKKDQLARDLAGADKKLPVLVGCPSCKVGVKRCLLQLGRHNPVLHAVEHLAACLGGPKWRRELRRAMESAEAKGSVLLVAALAPAGPPRS